MNCLTCRRTGVCDQLPDDMPARLAFAEQDHDCSVPHAPVVPRVDCPDCGQPMTHVGVNQFGSTDGCAHWACDCTNGKTRNWPADRDPVDSPCPICKPNEPYEPVIWD